MFDYDYNYLLVIHIDQLISCLYRFYVLAAMILPLPDFHPAFHGFSRDKKYMILDELCTKNFKLV